MQGSCCSLFPVGGGVRGVGGRQGKGREVEDSGREGREKGGERGGGGRIRGEVGGGEGRKERRPER